MTERWRQRRLHVENRLAELNAKHGQLMEEQLPPWLDSLEGYQAMAQQRDEIAEVAPPTPGTTDW